jgi:hypothetical protein
MELGVRKLKLNEVTSIIPEGGEDPYQMIQVHDYQGVSFFRMDPNVKASSKETISVFSMAYPELLSHKYFVNVPTIMGWVFAAMKLFVSPATLRKFHPLSSGASLVNEIENISSTLPKEYGGSGPSVKEGLTVKLADATPAVVQEAPKEDASETEAAKINEPAAENTSDAAVKPEETKVVATEPEESKVEEPKKETETETETAAPAITEEVKK